ncbi:hypothetical protein I4U23_016253 [Adineta vaga]|nr:hypothetical protein I4U23_016253 [Adineta vaga]
MCSHARSLYSTESKESKNTFVTTQVQFHEVCSSQFIKQSWFDMIFTNENISIKSTDDFRVTLSFFWQIIAGLCNASRKSWNDALANFNVLLFASPSTFNEETLRIQVQTILKNQIELSQTTMTRNLLAIRRMISGNQIVSGLQTNFYFFSHPSGSVQIAPRVFDNCSCLNIEGCPRSASFINNDGHSISIPGMIIDCLMIDATLSSTLECYYNQTCFSLLHSSLPINIQPLSNTSLKHFSLNSTIQILLYELMVEEMIINTHFDLYYSQCNPKYCSYSYTRRFHVVFVVTTIIGIFGGLSFGINFFAPLIAIIILRRKNRVLPNTIVSQIETLRQSRIRIVWTRIQSLPQYINEQVFSLNIFESSTPSTPNNIYRQRLFTRFFILLMIISSIIVGFYICLTEQNQLITVEDPSLTTYLQLYDDHSITLQCPCSQISIPYKSFLNVTFISHQVCSSDLVSSEWLTYLTRLDLTFIPEIEEGFDGTRDFRTIGASYFQLLSTFCSMIQMNIDDAQRIFINTQFINDHVLPPSVFLQKTQTIIDSFISTTRNNFARTIDWVNVVFSRSHFLNGANVVYQITETIDNQLDIIFPTYSIYLSFSETDFTAAGVCSCVSYDGDCRLIPLLYLNASYFDQSPSTLFFKIVKIGCTPLSGFQNSKISWWYNITYFQYIKETYSIVINSQSTPNIKALNASVPSRFNEDIETNELIREMFSEISINNNTNFDQFYNKCAPRTCTYSKIQRRNLLASLFLLIAICGGLNKGFRLLMPLFGKLFFSCIHWWKERHRRRGNYLFINIYQAIKTMNLFRNESIDERSIHQQQIYTRIYSILYLTSLSILLFYTAIVERSITKTYSVSSMMDYQQLLVDLQKDDIVCPCTRISIPYGEFINELRVNKFHEACTTDKILTILTAGSNTQAMVEVSNERNFQLWAPFFVESLTLFCSLSQDTIDDSIDIFLTSTILTNQLQPSVQFIDEINQTINQFQKRIPIIFAQTLDLIRMTIQGNSLLGTFASNWDILKIEEDIESNSSFITRPVIHNEIKQNISCSCSTSRTCSIPAEIITDNRSVIIQGLIFACHLLETTLLSSLSCFYFPKCIHIVRDILDLDTFDYDVLELLNDSLSRFSVYDTIETLTHEMFIESWISNISYESFYNSCSPNYCTYIYHYRFDALELLTTFLSIFAGLSIVIRFLVPYLVKIFQNLKQRFRFRNVRIVSVH